MIIKLLAIIAVLFLVYIVFFKNNRIKKNDMKNDNTNIKKEGEDILIECSTCKIMFSRDDGILGNGKYYCSKECLNK